MKRALKIFHRNLEDPVELILSKVTEVKTESKMIHIDELKDGTYRLIYNPKIFGDIGNLESIYVIRED
jgi:hypothetical protein